MVACAATTSDYKGPDAGYAVIGIGAASDTEFRSYSFLYRSAHGSDYGKFVYCQTKKFCKRGEDYISERERGVVEVRAMAPGDYELYSYRARLKFLDRDVTYRPDEEFSIPFSIKSGETTYLGNFEALGFWGEESGIRVPAGARFFHSDANARDLPLAKARRPEFDLSRVSTFMPPEEVVRKFFLSESQRADSKHQFSRD